MTPQSRLQQLPLLLRTVRHLPPRQILHRIRLRGQKAAMAKLPGLCQRLFTKPVTAPVPGWPTTLRPLDALEAPGYPDAETSAKGRFGFVGEQHEVAEPGDWEHPRASQLWRYHLHYFEWAWSFVAHADRNWARAEFARLWRSWQTGTVFGRWDAWSPYVVSLRTWTLCGLYEPLIRGTAEEEEYLQDIGRHARFVRANLEYDVGGNHLLKNLKALLGVSMFLGDTSNAQVALRELHKQVQIQVLSDGGHFERSPSYHCQVLGDLIDIRDLLVAPRGHAPGFLDEAIADMRRWLGAMLLPDGDVPLCNDCVLVGKTRLDLLQPEQQADAEPLQVLQPSGYVVLRPSDRVHLVLNVGPPCPPGLPAHAQADCLSFVLSLDGRRVIIDTGTSTYSPGPVRDYERSTKAHNTVEIDGHNQTETWGAFRAARRATPQLEQAEWDGTAATVIASHDGYERLPGRPRHRRTWRVTTEDARIHDEVFGSRWHEIVSRLRFAPELPVTVAGSQSGAVEGSVTVAFVDQTVRISGLPGITTHKEHVATAFGHRDEATVLEARRQGPLPIEMFIHMVWDGRG